jgi:transposase
VSGRTTRELVAKKKRVIATERDAVARARWREVMASVPAESLVFIDESGFHTRMTPVYACAPRGERADGAAPRNHTRNTTLVAARSLRGVGDTMTMEGAMDTAAFLAWLEQGLAPTLIAGQTVVMDNLSVHKNPQVPTIIAARGCRLVYLPAYSPDMTPIEGMFSKVKTAVRRAGQREQAGLVDAIGAALDTVTPNDATGWFTHCCYTMQSAQSLCEPL